MRQVDEVNWTPHHATSSQPPYQARWIRWLAWCAIPLIAYQVWTLSGWALDDPHQITAFRDRDTVSWTAARIIEPLLLASTVVIAALVWRDCRRRRRLTVDAMLIVGIASSSFWDPIYNWMTPAWLYSTNWIHVNDWFGHASLVLNPEAANHPWPIAPVLIGYAFWGVGFAHLDNFVMASAQRRWALGNGWVVALAYGLSGTLTAVAFAVFKGLDLMHAPGYRADFLFHNEFIVFFYSGALVFGTFSVIRYFRIFERGAHRTLVQLGAAVAACQLIVVIGWGLLTVPLSLYSAPYPETPAHLMNGLCDAPGTTGTDYGPCPGSPDGQIPLR